MVGTGSGPRTMQQERDGQEYDSKGGEHQQHVPESFATLFVVVEPVPQAPTQVHLGLHWATPTHARGYEDSLRLRTGREPSLGPDPCEAWNGHRW
jgi:hypothetical protein